MTHWPMQAIGIVESCFKEKFAIPRQPGLSPSAEAIVRLLPPFDTPEMVRGLDGFSHVWLLWIFHATAAQGWRPTVRPPKLGGNRRLGVLATRSTFRPNPVGLSVAKLSRIDTSKGVCLHVAGADLLDGTPVIDIKPYLHYTDAIADASDGYADCGAQPMPVAFTPAAEQMLTELSARYPRLRQLIIEVLAQDPRPGYVQTSAREYGMQLFDINIRWRCDGQQALVEHLHTVASDA